MLSQTLLQLKRKLEWEKRKLYSKLMTRESFYLLWDRFLDLFDITQELGDLANIVTHLLATLFALDFNIPELEIAPPEIPPLKVELERWGLTKYVAYEKGRYGISRYGRCYYDPEDWLKAIKRLWFYVLTQCYNYPTVQNEYRALAKALDMHENIPLHYLFRIDPLLRAVDQCIFNGAWVLGRSKLAPARKEGEKWVTELEFVAPNMRTYTVKVSNLLEVAHGLFNGLWVCGLGRLVHARLNPVPSDVVHWMRNDIRAQLDRFIFNISGRKLREFVPFERSPKTLKYAQHMHYVHDIHTIVKSFITQYETDPVRVNMYCRFAVEYVMGRRKSHRPSKHGFMYVSDEDWEEYIMTKWERMGLSRELMRRIISLIRPFAEQYWGGK